jgi:uncharacterized membrane protein YkvA (DUF1232 family)
MLEQLRKWARRLRIELNALYLAYQDPRLPWHARVVTLCVVGYALSPIDLIPDPIPILGYLDDLIIVPLGIWLAIKLIPGDVLLECRETARHQIEERKPTNWFAAGVIVAAWILFAALVGLILVKVL